MEKSAFLERGPLALNIGYVKDTSMVKITTAIKSFMAWYCETRQQVRDVPIAFQTPYT